MIDADVIVIGAGAAGLVAAARSAAGGARTMLLEKNRKAGVKILMSGGTRCNLTHDCDAAGIIEGFGKNGRFLRQALGELGPRETVAMFHALGVATKVEETGKIFPAADSAVVVRDGLVDQAVASGVQIELGRSVHGLRVDGSGGFFEVITAAGTCRAAAVIVTVGGKSWPECGTCGDGYGWLAGLGHTIRTPRPALVPLTGGVPWMRELSGLTLPRVEVGVWWAAKTASGSPPPPRWSKHPVERRTSGFLFTHFGFSGPAVMDVSRGVTAAADDREVRVLADFLPDLSRDEISAALEGARRARGGQHLVTLLSQWLPRRLAEGIVGCGSGHEGRERQERELPNSARQDSELRGHNPGLSLGELPIAEVRRDQMERVLQRLKGCPLEVTGTRGFAKAEVTAGGVDLAEVDPRTMASRKHAGLFIAGEILDLDGWIGGYNFQAAFSTGHVAGVSAGRFVRERSAAGG